MFNRSNLAVAGCISKPHYSNSVLFHKGGTVATDGQIAVSVSRPSGDIGDAPQILGKTPTLEFEDFCVSGEDVKNIKKSLSKKTTGSFPILRNAFVIGEGQEKRLAATDLSSTVAVNTSEDGGPPKSAKDLDKMTPEGEPLIEVCLDAELMGRFMAIFKEAQGDKYSYPVTLKIWAKDKVIRAEAENIDCGQKIIGLIMPFQK